MSNETIITYSHTPDNFEASVDGWQAYCAEQGLSANPYKRFSEDWKVWKAAYLRAKGADKLGIMCAKEVPAEQYRIRHQYDEQDEGWYSSTAKE